MPVSYSCLWSMHRKEEKGLHTPGLAAPLRKGFPDSKLAGASPLLAQSSPAAYRDSTPWKPPSMNGWSSE
eukprot:scaffold230223_cov21-Tisochrysis_lutea.AAC.1